MTERIIQPSGARTEAAGTLLKIKRIPQVQSEWCWAACGEMVQRYLGLPATQCLLVNAYTQGKGNCIDACRAQGGDCNVPCQTDRLSAVFERFDVKTTLAYNAIPSSLLANEIVEHRRPVMALLRFGNGAAHVVLLVGYKDDGTTRMVYVIDTRPSYGEGWVDYSALLQAHGHGAWISSWTEIGRIS